MIMGTEVSEVSRYLRLKSIIIPSNNYWLTSCVECFKEQGSYNLTQLKELVYQQWLLADLSDIAVQVLPDTCLSEEKTFLQGQYAVQFNSFVNIAVSFHKQLQKIRRPESINNLEVDSENTSNDKEVVSGNRTLKIEITDGVLTVVGFEDHFIPFLKEPLVPGKKAILVGPLECRKGVLFLRPLNIKVLGGEVDALHISNASENILARALKLPENPDPYHLGIVKEESNESGNALVNSNYEVDDEEAMMMLADVIESEVSTDEADSKVNPSNIQRRDQTKKHNTNVELANEQSNVSQRLIASRKEVPNKQFISSISGSLIADDFDDDMAELEQKINFNKRTESVEFDDDFELLEDQTSRTKNLQQNSIPINIDSSTTSFTECLTLDITSSKKQYEQITELKKILNESYSSSEVQPSTSGSRSVTVTSHPNSSRNERIIVDYLSEAESPLIKLNMESQSSDVTSSFPSDVDDSDNIFLNSDPFPPKKRPALVKAHARVVKVLKKPKLVEDKWSLTAIVATRGIELEVIFASDVVDKVFEISAAEIISRRAELISNPLLKQKTNEILKRSQLRFSNLECFMVFSFKNAISKPVVVDVDE